MHYSKSREHLHRTAENNSRDDEFANLTDSEIEQAVELLDTREPTPTPESGKGKKVTRPAHGTDASDKETLKTIANFGLVQIVVGSHTVRNFTPPSFTPKRLPPNLSKTLSKASGEPTPKPANDNKLPTWKKSGQRLKFGMALQSLSGRGHAFTLLFGPSRLQELLDSPKGFSRALALYMDRALMRKLGYVPDYCFVVEMTPGGKLHVHGGIASTADNLHLIEEALNHAGGGGWEKSRRGEKQFMPKPLFYPTGWCRYSFEDEPKARRAIKGQTVVINSPLRRSAKALYGAVKKIIDRA